MPDRLSKLLQRWGPLFALLLLISLAAWVDHANKPDERHFLTWANFSNILRQNSVVGIIALGMTFIIILGGIDLSVGSMVALLGGVGIIVMNKAAAAWSTGSWAPILAASAVMLIGGPLLGALNGIIITKGKIAPFIATLGAMAMFRSLALVLIDGGEYRSQVPDFSSVASPAWLDSLRLPESFGSLGRLTPALIFFAIAIALQIILKHTRYGTAVHAVGDNDKAALYAGLKLDRIKIATYALGGLMCGISALLISSRMNSVSSAQTGQLYELDAIAAVVVGGASMRGGSGRILGTIVGVLILGVVNNMLNMISSTDSLQRLGLEHINIAHLQGLVKGIIIIAAVLVQRQKD